MRLSPIRRLAFVAICTVITVFISERVYWFAGTEPSEQLVLLAFYSPAVAAVLWLVSRYRVGDIGALLLVAPVYGYVIEGAVVPVLYSGGPFVPFFPAMFTFWHGVLGVVVALFLFRRWLLAGQWKPLLASSITLGAYWGMWALTAAVEDEDVVTEIFTPNQFVVYTTVCCVAFAAAHWTLGFVWMTSFEPSKRLRQAWCLVVGAVVVAWTFVIPWAAPMFAAYVGIQIWALRRTPPDRPTSLLEELVGRVRLRAMWPLIALPVVASLSYQFWFNLELSPETIENWIFILSSILQACVGLALLIWSHWHARALRSARSPLAGPILRLSGGPKTSTAPPHAATRTSSAAPGRRDRRRAPRAGRWRSELRLTPTS